MIEGECSDAAGHVIADECICVLSAKAERRLATRPWQLSLMDCDVSAVQAHSSEMVLLLGTDQGHCALCDARSGQQEWLYGGDAPPVRAVAMVPGQQVTSAVAAGEDGTLSLLDLRRQGPAALLASVSVPQPLTSVATDGCTAVAGTNGAGVLVWNLDPASEQTGSDRAAGIMCTGAGLAFPRAVAESGPDRVHCLDVVQSAEGWHLVAGQDGCIQICSMGDAQSGARPRGLCAQA
jgi:hypothetical protein